MVLEPMYEADFLDVFRGFRPGPGAHGALDSLWKQTMGMRGGWIVDVDLRRFFDTIDKGHLREFLKRRVPDGYPATDRQMAQRRGVGGGSPHDPRDRHSPGRRDHAPNNVANDPVGGPLQKGRD